MQLLTPYFISRIKKDENGCWIWHSKDLIYPRAYGGIVYKGRAFRAHRVSYLLFIGVIPEGNSICHTCDNPFCVSPFHLFAGTHKDNMQDAGRKGRKAKKRHGFYKNYILGCRCDSCKNAFENRIAFYEETAKILKSAKI